MGKDYEHHSVSVRKISNGYVTSHSSSKGDELSKTQETFHKKRPRIKLSMQNPFTKVAGKAE